MTIFQVLLLLALYLVTLKVYKAKKRRCYSLPPGPRGYPFVGNTFQIAKNAHLQLSKWAEQYGKLYTITIGNGISALVVNDIATIKKIFSLTESTGRFISEIYDSMFDGPCGILNSEGVAWQEQREFCVKKLKSLGFDKGSYVEPRMLLQVEKLCHLLEKEMNEKGKVLLSPLVIQTSGNTIWEILTGEQMHKNVHMMENLHETLKKASDAGLGLFSWIKYIAPEVSGYNAYLKSCKELHNYVRSRFAKYESEVGNDDDAKHMVAFYSEHVKKMKNNVSSVFYGDIGYMQGVKSVCSLLIAGVETTAITLHWLIFYLCVHPDVQRKVQEEIEETIGSDGRPSLKDRERMPYTEAVILEALRVSTLAPAGLFQRLMEDVTFENYKFPKDLVLIANLYHVHNDKSIWGDPENFRPERFLDNSNIGNEKTFNSLKHSVVSFQAGKRVCIGEQMAKEVVFLFITGLLQKFSFSMEDEATAEMYMKPVVGLMLTPSDSLGVKVIKKI